MDRGAWQTKPRGCKIVRHNLTTKQQQWPRQSLKWIFWLQVSCPVCACVISHFSYVWLFVTLWTVACQAPLSMGFSRQEDWSGLPHPSPEDLPHPGLNPCPLHLLNWQIGSLVLVPPGKTLVFSALPELFKITYLRKYVYCCHGYKGGANLKLHSSGSLAKFSPLFYDLL